MNKRTKFDEWSGDTWANYQLGTGAGGPVRREEQKSKIVTEEKGPTKARKHRRQMNKLNPGKYKN